MLKNFLNKRLKHIMFFFLKKKKADLLLLIYFPLLGEEVSPKVMVTLPANVTIAIY